MGACRTLSMHRRRCYDLIPTLVAHDSCVSKFLFWFTVDLSIIVSCSVRYRFSATVLPSSSRSPHCALPFNIPLYEHHAASVRCVSSGTNLLGFSVRICHCDISQNGHFVYACPSIFRRFTQLPDDGPNRDRNLYLSYYKYTAVLD